MDVLYEPLGFVWLGQQPYVLMKPTKCLPYPACFTVEDVLEARAVVLKAAALLSEGSSFAIVNTLMGAYERSLGGRLSEDDLAVLFGRYGLDVHTGVLYGMQRDARPSLDDSAKKYKHLRFFA